MSAPVDFSFAVACGLAGSALLAIGAPIAAALLFRRATGAPWRALLIGAATFAISQLVLRLPWQIALGVWLKDRLASDAALMFGWIAVSAGTAALFEETGRLIAFRRFLTAEQSFRGGVFFGIGHGGLEAILLVGVSLVANFVIYVLFTTGVPLPLPAEANDAIAKQFSQLTPGLALLGGIERLSSLSVHVGLSLMVLRAVTTRRYRWYVVALAFHAASNLVGVQATRTWGPYWGEACIAAFALTALAFVGLEARRLSTPA